MGNKSFFDQHYNSYEDQVESAIKFAGLSHDFYTQVKVDNLRELIEESFPINQALKVLDLGCGIGLTHQLLHQGKRLQVTGADVSADSLREAQRRNPNLKYELIKDSVLPFQDSSFDVVFCFCVVHHVLPENWSQFYSEMKRILKPNGLIVIAEHNPINPVTRWVVSQIPFDKDAVLLTPRVSRSLVGRGYKSKTRYILFFPFKSKLFRRLEKHLSWLPFGAQYMISFRKVDQRNDS